MALFMDGNPTSISDLARLESTILEVAATENIDLSAKASLATLDISLTLQRFLNTTPGGRAFTLGHVVATDALRQWHALLTLAATFRDAHFQQLNDRHKYKWKEYEAMARECSRTLLETGVGMVYNPIPKGAAPTLGQVGGSQPARTYYVRTAWVDSLGVEGMPGEIASMTTMEGTALTVRVAGAPYAARGWNVYAGLIDDQITRQNNAPIEPGSTWTLPAAGLSTTGNPPGTGQTAEYFLQQIPVLQRG
jgi:hypothetical protein